MDPFNKSASMVGSAGLSWIWKAIQFSVGGTIGYWAWQLPERYSNTTNILRSRIILYWDWIRRSWRCTILDERYLEWKKTIYQRSRWRDPHWDYPSCCCCRYKYHRNRWWRKKWYCWNDYFQGQSSLNDLIEYLMKL
mgnify:CR=1 FL=1